MTVLIIDEDGDVRAIYSDEAAVLLAEVGRLHVNRASHVEPTADVTWTADMRPVGGPLLGPFPTRTAALEAEYDYLIANDIPEVMP